MIKMASGVAAKAGGPRGFMWVMMTLAAIGVAAAFWVYGAAFPLIVWLALNGTLLLVFSCLCCIDCSDGRFDWSAIDRPLVLWAIMAEWGESDQPSWLRLIVWMLLIPAEIAATFVLWPITLGARALLKPMPGRWD